MRAAITWFALMFAVTPGELSAQIRRGGDTLSDQAVADSQSVIAQLTVHLKSNPRDADAWTRIGLAAWTLQERAKAPQAPKLDATRLGRMADTSLRIAAELQPGNVVAQLNAGDFLLGTGVSTTRSASVGYYRAALTAARASRSDTLHARAAVSLGKASWRRYESLANRRMTTNISDVGRSLTEAMQPVAKAALALEELSAHARAAETDRLITASGSQSTASAMAAAATAAIGNVLLIGPTSLQNVRSVIEGQSMALPASVTGGGELARADSLFEEAYQAQPANPMVFRTAAMVRCERNDWAGLERFSRAHLTRFPNDVHARLALGLALHRQGNTRVASAVFDTAYAKLSYSESRRLDRPGRTIPPSKASQTDITWAGARDAFSSVFWGMADPSWNDGISERRVEFRARVTYAEIRWTIEEEELRGASTDRGDVHIRYGPPDLVAVFGPNVSENAGDIMTFWLYNSGLMFAFSSLTGNSTARIPPADRAMIDNVIDAQPARWDNVVRPPVDSIITHIAQFRAGGDSIEMVVASLAPPGTIRDSASKGHVWMLSAAGVITVRDSSTISRDGVANWVVGMHAAYEYLLRVESGRSGTGRLGRFQTYLRRDGTLITRGAGLSDVLVASSVAESNTPLKRWRDAKATPSVGAVDRGKNVWLVWENYDFGAEAGALNYDVTISLRRVRSGAGRIVANVTGALAGIARINIGENQADVQFSRTVPQAATAVEAVSLDLGTTPAGVYSVTVQVADKAGQRTMSRTVMLTVRD